MCVEMRCGLGEEGFCFSTYKTDGYLLKLTKTVFFKSSTSGFVIFFSLSLPPKEYKVWNSHVRVKWKEDQSVPIANPPPLPASIFEIFARHEDVDLLEQLFFRRSGTIRTQGAQILVHLRNVSF